MTRERQDQLQSQLQLIVAEGAEHGKRGRGCLPPGKSHAPLEQRVMLALIVWKCGGEISPPHPQRLLRLQSSVPSPFLRALRVNPTVQASGART
jgi:hypothetical protein